MHLDSFSNVLSYLPIFFPYNVQRDKQSSQQKKQGNIQFDELPWFRDDHVHHRIYDGIYRYSQT